ncbi:MAG TPA: c-type cytochrome domain-containing protein, partial [Planctomycetaceae bacterium]
MTRLLAAAVWLTTAAAFAADAPDYARDVQPLLTKYCAGCHNADDASGDFVLDDFDSLMKGGENGAVLVPGKVDESRLIRLIEGTAEPVMPPDKEPAPTADEVAVLKAWIAAGAKGPAGDGVPTLDVPRIAPTGPVRRPVHAAAWSPDGRTLAVGRYRSVELLDRDLKPLGAIDGLAGQINALAFLDGDRLFAAGGEPGLAGEAGVWDIRTGQPVWKTVAHRDAVTAGAVSPDGRLVATGGYDQTILVWDAATGERKAELAGHNGPVFGLAFHPTKPVLASASGDRTVKLWDVATGERLDTLKESQKELYCLAFSPDGSRLAAA